MPANNLQVGGRKPAHLIYATFKLAGESPPAFSVWAGESPPTQSEPNFCWRANARQQKASLKRALSEPRAKRGASERERQILKFNLVKGIACDLRCPFHSN